MAEEPRRPAIASTVEGEVGGGRHAEARNESTETTEPVVLVVSSISLTTQL
jgi:hypothetical protein